MSGFGDECAVSRRRSPGAAQPARLLAGLRNQHQFSGAMMHIALTTIATILIATIGRLTWGAVLVGRDYDSEG